MFWRYRKVALDNPVLHQAIMDAGVTKNDDRKLQTLLDFYEEVGLHASRSLIDLPFTDEIFGDGIITASESPHIQQWIDNVRKEERDKTYYSHFTALGKQLRIKAAKRKEE